MLIYHLLSRAAWQEARQTGFYRPPSLQKEGFIHFSQKEQILSVANAFYHAQTDLLLLTVQTESLQAGLRFEAPIHPSGAASAPVPDQKTLFPHLYGPLNLDSVLQALPFPPNPDGTFSLPPEMQE